MTGLRAHGFVAASDEWLEDAPWELNDEGNERRSIPASEIKPQAIEWLWPERIALGFLNVLAGPQGSGKSTILYDLAARVSREGRPVLIATAEDHLAAVVRPRLEAADARMEHVHIWNTDLVFPSDIGALREEAELTGAVLVTVDPLVAFLEGRIDTHKDGSVRQALAPLAKVAESIGCAVVTVLHTNKGASDDPLFRIGGSGAFTAAARHVLMAHADPEDESGDRRFLALVKSNLARFAPALEYRIDHAVIYDADEQPIDTSKVAWGDEIPGVDVRALLRHPLDPEERSAVEEAEEFLAAELAAGPRRAGEVLRAAKSASISERTLKRAKGRLRVMAERINDDSGRVAGWEWSLPEGHGPGGQRVSVPLGPLDATSGNGAPKTPEGQGAKTTGHLAC